MWPDPSWTWEEVAATTRRAEAAGWSRVYVADHFMPSAEEPADGDVLECWSVLAALAATVPRIGLAPLVTSVTYRHPAVLANIAATVDRISGGRLVLGVGAGWQVNEHAAYGLELGTVTERLDRFEEACAVLSSLLSTPRTTFVGRHYRIEDAPLQPGPVHGRMPLLVGGGGERRTLRVAARFADEWNVWSTPDVLAHKLGVLRAHCEDLGRDPAGVHVSTQALVAPGPEVAAAEVVTTTPGGLPLVRGSAPQLVDALAAYREAGADEFVVPCFGIGSARSAELVDLFTEEVAPALA